MTIHDLNGKTSQPNFWHAMPRKWEPDTLVQGQALEVTIDRAGVRRPARLYLHDGAACTYDQFLTRWSEIDGVPKGMAPDYYRQWWGVDPTSAIRVFLLSHQPIQTDENH